VHRRTPAVGRSHRAQLGVAVVTAGLAISGIATAAPAGAAGGTRVAQAHQVAQVHRVVHVRRVSRVQAVHLVKVVRVSRSTKASKTMKSDLHKLRICESGDNYRENTGNGYFGAYQFAGSTWRALGFNGRPDRARSATQDRAARKLHRVAGWSAWPSCSHTEHLR
jgi:Transglycosylase-like domain